jgi:thiol:disulfide interchange protein DsbA
MMARETGKSSLAPMAILFVALLAGVSARAAPATGIIAGSNYKELDVPQPTNAAPGTVELIEFMWYDCDTCYVVEPTLRHWVAEHGSSVTFRRVPAVVGSYMLYYARVFYTAEALGVLDKIHEPLYTAIHRYNRPLSTADQIADFLAEYGVERGRFLSTFRNAVTAEKVRDARLMTERYDIAGVPTFIVNGKYRVDPTMVPNAETLMQVVGYLVERERGGKK